MKKTALLCALLLLCCAGNAPAAGGLRGEIAEVLLDRLAMLYESRTITSFDRLDDALLDKVAGDFATSSSPMSHALHYRETSPQFFSGPLSVDPHGNPYDTAIAKKDAAEIATFYFGKPAPLKGIKGNFMYDFMHDGPRICSTEVDKVEKTPYGYRIGGTMSCAENGPDTAPVPRALLEAEVLSDSHAPLGWVVRNFHAEELSFSSVYRNSSYGFEVSWMPGNFTVRESDSGDGVTVSDPALGVELKAWGSRYWEVMGMNFEAGVRDSCGWFDHIILKKIDKQNKSFVLSGTSGKNNLYVKGMVLPDGDSSVTCFLSVSYPQDKQDIFDEFTAVASRTFRPLGKSAEELMSQLPERPGLTERLLIQEVMAAMWHEGVTSQEEPVLLQEELRRSLPEDVFCRGNIWMTQSNWVMEGEIRRKGVLPDGIEYIADRATFHVEIERDSESRWILHHIRINPWAVG